MAVVALSEWVSMSRWEDCKKLERPGVIFEIRNIDDQRLFTNCISPPPKVPFDWKSPPVSFRAIEEPKSRHSDPLPPPGRDP